MVSVPLGVARADQFKDRFPLSGIPPLLPGELGRLPPTHLFDLQRPVYPGLISQLRPTPKQVKAIIEALCQHLGGDSQSRFFKGLPLCSAVRTFTVQNATARQGQLPAPVTHQQYAARVRHQASRSLSRKRRNALGAGRRCLPTGRQAGYCGEQQLTTHKSSQQRRDPRQFSVHPRERRWGVPARPRRDAPPLNPSVEHIPSLPGTVRPPPCGEYWQVAC